MVNTKKAENYGLLVTLPATLDETELARLHELIAARKSDAVKQGAQFILLITYLARTASDRAADPFSVCDQLR